MTETRIASLEATPLSIADWEDLLVRMEILPRALRVTMEDLPAEEARATSALRDALGREVELFDWLQRASAAPAADAAHPLAGVAPELDAHAMADRLASLRARNFAMLQRRGLDVWAWTAPIGAGTLATAYQMVTALVLSDAEMLGLLREGRRLGAGAC